MYLPLPQNINDYAYNKKHDRQYFCSPRGTYVRIM